MRTGINNTESVRCSLILQRKHRPSSSDDSDGERSVFVTPSASVPDTSSADIEVEKKHKKKKKKKAKDDEDIDTSVQEKSEKKVCFS